MPLTDKLQEEPVGEEVLDKQSCHDSGIDIRDTTVPPPVTSSTTKKVGICKQLILMGNIN